jgi:hypothetical protein
MTRQREKRESGPKGTKGLAVIPILDDGLTRRVPVAKRDAYDRRVSAGEASSAVVNLSRGLDLYTEQDPSMTTRELHSMTTIWRRHAADRRRC